MDQDDKENNNENNFYFTLSVTKNQHKLMNPLQNHEKNVYETVWILYPYLKVTNALPRMISI